MYGFYQRVRKYYRLPIKSTVTEVAEIDFYITVVSDHNNRYKSNNQCKLLIDNHFYYHES